MQPQNCNKYTACYAPHIIILYNIRYGYGYYTGIISPPSVSAFMSRRYTFARAIVAARLSRMPRILRHALLMICIVCHVAFSLRQQRTEAAIGRSRLAHSLVVFFMIYKMLYYFRFKVIICHSTDAWMDVRPSVNLVRECQCANADYYHVNGMDVSQWSRVDRGGEFILELTRLNMQQAGWVDIEWIVWASWMSVNNSTNSTPNKSFISTKMQSKIMRFKPKKKKPLRTKYTIFGHRLVRCRFI